jgi:hypothetical protein
MKKLIADIKTFPRQEGQALHLFAHRTAHGRKSCLYEGTEAEVVDNIKKQAHMGLFRKFPPRADGLIYVVAAHAWSLGRVQWEDFISQHPEYVGGRTRTRVPGPGTLSTDDYTQASQEWCSSHNPFYLDRGRTTNRVPRIGLLPRERINTGVYLNRKGGPDYGQYHPIAVYWSIKQAVQESCSTHPPPTYLTWKKISRLYPISTDVMTKEYIRVFHIICREMQYRRVKPINSSVRWYINNQPHYM